MAKRWYAFLLTILLCGPGMAGQVQRKFDRMRAIEEFLLTVYPTLQGRLGQLTFEVEELNLRPEGETSIYVDFAQCHVGSGVPGGGQPQFRSCPVPAGGLPLTDYLLRARIDIGGTSEDFQISEFWAHGELVTAKLDALRAQIGQNPAWTDEQILDVLERANPKFGPTQRQAFAKQVPLELVRRFSGCNLDLSQMRLVAHRTIHPTDPPELDLYWEVVGSHTRRAFYGGGEYKQVVERCFARFEPFEGNLITLDAR